MVIAITTFTKIMLARLMAATTAAFLSFRNLIFRKLSCERFSLRIFISS